jgi:hypothetical protein
MSQENIPDKILKEQKDEHSVEEIESFDKKKSYLENLTNTN